MPRVLARRALRIEARVLGAGRHAPARRLLQALRPRLGARQVAATALRVGLHRGHLPLIALYSYGPI